MSDVVRIANCSGFYGDRFAAAREMVEGGPIDFLTGDYLAELTMMILVKDRMRDPELGYARSFLGQLEEVARLCKERGVRIVVNAGGLNPAGLARAARALYERLGLDVRVAHIEGDDLMPRLAELQARGHPLAHLDHGRPLSSLKAPVLSANVYLGAWGIVTALEHGAELVICPRVTDAALTLGPAAWKHGWSRDDWDRLAAGIVAGHILECGAQCTGGNYAFFREVSNLEHVGFPLAEIHADGQLVITKHPGTGGAVTVGTVTAQLLYEIAEPEYLNPDVTACFDSIELCQDGPDRVRVRGVRGAPPPETAKVCINHVGGYKNRMTFVLTGLDIEAKARLAEETLWRAVGGRERFQETLITLERFDRPDPERNEDAFAYLTVAVKDPDARKVGRDFSGKVVEMALASYPGFTMTSPPGRESIFGVYWPALLPADLVRERVVFEDEVFEVEPAPRKPIERPSERRLSSAGPPPEGPTRDRPIGTICGARSGDKGGHANIGVWVRSPEAYAWLVSFLDTERLRSLVPEARNLDIERHELPNLLALNFVVKGLLGEGVAASLRPDPQAKTLGEYLRARVVSIPVALLPEG
ncbi:MAG: acyclic terpene utilization AtuA family protein [Myxococcota bacterium]